MSPPPPPPPSAVAISSPSQHTTKATSASKLSSIPTNKISKFETSEAHAKFLDQRDPIRHLRAKYIIPTKSSLKATTLKSVASSQQEGEADDIEDGDDNEKAVYLCGNSLGLQARHTHAYIAAQLATWSSLGVYGHFTPITDESSSVTTPAWQDLAAHAATRLVPLVGAKDASEVVVMNTLTVNLHLAMAAFYRPTGQRKKVLLERKAFPSDHYAIESQARWWGLAPQEAMVLLGPEMNHGDGNGPDEMLIDTETILRVLEEQGEEIALVLLPGVQYYTGQVFEMDKITKAAHAKGCVVGWDLAHAVGNVELKLHDWNVDFAVWCHYKYLNAGPGAIAGMFVHKRHGQVERVGVAQHDHHDSVKGDTSVIATDVGLEYMPRLMGWYGGDKGSRFRMDNKFVPIPGAGGFQVSNPSALDLTSLIAALDVFQDTNIEALRQKSLQLTAYLQFLLLQNTAEDDKDRKFRIITPLDPKMRGAQLSLMLKPGYLKQVGTALKEAGVVVDQREPDVIRVAPVPMYNTHADVWKFVREFKKALGIWREE